MENKKIVKVYSNNNKKARLKRNKNKFQRIWDAEKGTYIKVRKAKYPVRTKAVKKHWRDVDKSKALARRVKTLKKSKSVPVNAAQMSKKISDVLKPETKQQVRKESARRATTVRIHGVNLTWDSKTLRYKRAA